MIDVTVNDDGSLPQQLREELSAINKLYSLPEWKAVDTVFRRFIEKLRDQNEQIMEPDQRNFLLGRLYELRGVVNLPHRLRELVDEYKRVAKLQHPALTLDNREE